MTPREANLNKILTAHPFDFGWAVGLIEGEGCITITHGKRDPFGCPYIKVAMTDEDSVRRIFQITGLGSFRPVPRSDRMPEHHKSQWAWTVAQEREAQALLVLILPHLSARRAEAAWRVLDLIDMRRELRAQKAAVCGNGHDQATHRYTDPSGVERCRECVKINSRAAYARKRGGPA